MASKICSVDGCDRSAETINNGRRGLCDWHYDEWLASGKGPCSAVGCPNRAYRRGLCGPHYRDTLKGKDPDGRPIRKRLDVSSRDPLGRKLCTRCREWKAEGDFGRRSRSRDGLSSSCLDCTRSYARKGHARRNGLCPTPDCTSPRRPGGDLCVVCERRVGDGTPLNAPRRGDIHYLIGISYAHVRVRELWGKANQYSCIECGNQAAQWAYDGTDPTQLLGPPRGNAHIYVGWYSRYPEFYMPMCVGCHRRRDAAERSRELYEFRWFKYHLGDLVTDLFEFYRSVLPERQMVS